MTTNIDRAVDLLGRAHAADQMAMEGAIGYFDATAAARALADAGLLMPDLPEPAGATKGVWSGGGWCVYRMIDGIEATTECDLDIVDAEAFALAILAAARKENR